MNLLKALINDGSIKTHTHTHHIHTHHTHTHIHTIHIHTYTIKTHTHTHHIHTYHTIAMGNITHFGLRSGAPPSKATHFGKKMSYMALKKDAVFGTS